MYCSLQIPLILKMSNEGDKLVDWYSRCPYQSLFEIKLDKNRANVREV